MTGQEDVWDAFYRSNGRAWRGNCRMPDPFGGRGDALDIGCGSGKSTSSLIDMGYDVTGVDFSAEAVSICRDRFDARFEQGSVLALPFPDGSFDYITLIHVLEHVPDGDMPSVAYEVRRVLRTGGHVFIRDFAPGDLRSGSREDRTSTTSTGARTPSPDSSTASRSSVLSSSRSARGSEPFGGDRRSF